MGALEYTYLFTYAVALVFMGRIAERSDLRKFLAVGMVLSGISTVLFGIARTNNIHSFYYFLFVQFISGIVQASGWPAIITVVSNWFGDSKVGLLLGLWNANGAFGNAIGAFISGYFVESDWGLSFIIPGLILSIYGISSYFFLLNRPEDIPDLENIQNTLPKNNPNDHDEKPKPHSEETISLTTAIFLPNVISYSLVLFFNKIVISTFMYWLPNFLMAFNKFVTPEQAAQMSTLFDFGSIAGGIIAGFISDEKEPRKGSSLYRRAVTICCMLFLSCPI
ncbi:hypothetical protein Ciccas_012026, partial [Cichlidogyrus casuarinus]